jgi:hypothetical protein
MKSASSASGDVCALLVSSHLEYRELYVLDHCHVTKTRQVNLPVAVLQQ